MSARDRLPILIGARRYNGEVIGIEIVPHGDTAQVLDTQAEPGEQSIENRGIWKRTAEDFVLGAGQEYFDLRSSIDPSVSERHRWSRGLKMLGEHRKIELLEELTEEDTVAHGGFAGGNIVGSGDRVYWHYLFGMRVSDAGDLTTWSAATGLPAGVVQIAVLNGLVYVATTTALYVNSSGSPTAFTALGAVPSNVVVAAAGRLIGMVSNAIWEYDSAGAKLGGDNIFEHSWSDFTFQGGVSTPVGVYCFGSAGAITGARSEIYLLTPVDATGEFAPPYPVGETEDGETILTMVEYGGFMFIGTTLGLRIAQIADAGILSIGPLIDDVGRIDQLVKRGRFLYGTHHHRDPTGTIDDAGTVVFDLKRFTDTLEPAWAAHLAVGGTRTAVYGLAEVGGQLVILANDGTNHEIWVQSTTTRVATGEIRFGGYTFGTAELMALSSVELDSDPLPAGAELEIDFYDRINGTKTDLITFDQDDDTNHVYRWSTAYTVEEGELAVTLDRATDTSVSPVLRRATVRGVPMIKHSYMIELPIMLFDEVTIADDDHAVRLDVEDELLYLWSLVDGTVPVSIEIGSLEFLARVRGLMINPAQGQAIGGGVDDWQGEPGREFVNGVWSVILETVSDVPFSFS